MNGIPYKDTTAAKSSALAAAIALSQAAAKKVYEETTQRFNALHSEADRAWFRSWRTA